MCAAHGVFMSRMLLAQTVVRAAEQEANEKRETEDRKKRSYIKYDGGSGIQRGVTLFPRSQGQRVRYMDTEESKVSHIWSYLVGLIAPFVNRLWQDVPVSDTREKDD